MKMRFIIFDYNWECAFDQIDDYNINTPNPKINEISRNSAHITNDLSFEKNNSLHIKDSSNFIKLIMGSLYSTKKILFRMDPDSEKDSSFLNTDSSMVINVGDLKLIYWESPTKFRFVRILPSSKEIVSDDIQILKNFYFDTFIPLIMRNPLHLRSSTMSLISINFNDYFRKIAIEKLVNK